jgi:5-formyltetrahydrofolate cyclo-ligase
MKDITLSKIAARKGAFARRKAAKSPARDAKAVSALLAAVLPMKGRVLAGYMPILTEVDPLPVMAAMASFGPVCVPVIQGDGLPLRFRVWTPGCKMIAGPFGAMVPEAGVWLEPEVVIVPLVAFSSEGARLGYGGGYYDRTLEGLRARGEVTAYGYAFKAQRMPGLPQEPTDQRLDGIVTEDGLELFGS